MVRLVRLHFFLNSSRTEAATVKVCDRPHMSATILYLDTIPGKRIQEMTLAGIRRYAAARG